MPSPFFSVSLCTDPPSGATRVVVPVGVVPTGAVFLQGHRAANRDGIHFNRVDLDFLHLVVVEHFVVVELFQIVAVGDFGQRPHAIGRNPKPGAVFVKRLACLKAFAAESCRVAVRDVSLFRDDCGHPNP